MSSAWVPEITTARRLRDRRWLVVRSRTRAVNEARDATNVTYRCAGAHLLLAGEPFSRRLGVPDTASIFGVLMALSTLADCEVRCERLSISSGMRARAPDA